MYWSVRETQLFFWRLLLSPLWECKRLLREEKENFDRHNFFLRYFINPK